MAWILSAFADEAGRTCEEQINGLQQAGLRHIDIRGIEDHNITTMPLDYAKKVREKLDAAGIKVHMFGSPLGKIDLADEMKIDLDKLRHLGALAPILGCRAVRIFSYYNNKAKKPQAEFQKESLARLHQLKALAKELGLILYHENEAQIFGDRCADVLTIAHELRDAGGQGTFRMIFDFGNYNNGGENAWENWLQLRDLTDAFHLKDSVQTPQGLHHVPVGQGGGCVAQILTDAAARHWDGPLTVEPHLQHSAAVVATGPGGVANQAYAKMTAQESFQVACRAAHDVCRKAGATVL